MFHKNCVQQQVRQKPVSEGEWPKNVRRWATDQPMAERANQCVLAGGGGVESHKFIHIHLSIELHSAYNQAENLTGRSQVELA